MPDRVTITQGKYIASAVKKEQYPEVRRREIVFIGRSNVGKSSLINSLARTKNLARVSGQPGKTQTINFYELLMRIDGGEERHPVHLVDLPGYGYAKAARESRKTWAKFIEEYFLHAENLHFVCLLLDIRHEPMSSDRKMFDWLVSHDIPVLVVATKADKLGRTARQKQLSLMRKTLGVPDLSILPYSVPKNEGRTELLDVMKEYLLE